jgi:hypothetical protein
MPAENPFMKEGPSDIGKGEQQSRQKAEQAHERSKSLREDHVDAAEWPRGVTGAPMVKIAMTAAELLPTGQFANVSIGPAQITAFVDPDRQVEEAYFSKEQRDTLALALNELAEIVEGDVIAVQRNLVQESIQDQIASNSKS